MLPTIAFRSLLLAIAAVAGLVACARQDNGQTFGEARKGFVTSFNDTRPAGETPQAPLARDGQLVRYPSTVGSLAAYLTPVPKDGVRHPAIVWITGGDSNTIDASVFENQPPDNDQTARQYREAGIVMMYPSLRGGNDNPGHREGLYGEVDDVLAAADWLAKQPGIDPARIYLGGHSVGGTLVTLVSEASPRFRATFAFGAVTDPALYQGDPVPLAPTKAEMALRRPVDWLSSVKSPLFMLEGTDGPVTNIDELRAFEQANTNPQVHFVALPGTNHFSDLASANRVIAAKILADTGPKTALTLSEAEVRPKQSSPVLQMPADRPS